MTMTDGEWTDGERRWALRFAVALLGETQRAFGRMDVRTLDNEAVVDALDELDEVITDVRRVLNEAHQAIPLPPAGTEQHR